MYKIRQDAGIRLRVAATAASVLPMSYAIPKRILKNTMDEKDQVQ